MSVSLKVKKAAPKKKKRGKEKEKVIIDADFLRSQRLFDTLDERTRTKIAPRIQYREFARGETIYKGPPMEEEFSPIYFVIFGDIAIYKHLKDPKTQQEYEEVSNYLSVGEAYVQKLHHHETTQALEVRAMCPVKLLFFTYKELNYLLSKGEEFQVQFGQMIREVLKRQASRFDDDFQKEIASFFVKERLTFARRVKIKRMDICIECDGCYTACKTRHGTDRLGASEVKYGITEIPNNCHNCVVPECIDKCKFGHITRHEETNEIIISDNCVGCTKCSKGCSFNAIQMHPIDTLDLKRYFPDRDPSHKGKQIAQKCDNCTDYEDLACVTACPTGALFQVDGPDLFNYWEQFNVHKNPGFDVVISPEDSANRARSWWMAFTLLNFIFLTYECLTRVWAPEFALGHIFYQWGLKAEDLDFDKPLRAGKEFGHALGYIATSCMLLTQLYIPGRKLAPRFGSVQLWFEVHIWFGFLGFIYGFYHTAFHWREMIAVTSFTLFTITIITGVIGRYLVFHIPRDQAGKELEMDEIEQRIQSLNQEIERRFKDRKEGYTMMLKIDELKSLQETSTQQEFMFEHDQEEEPEGLRAVLKKIKQLMIGDKQHEEAIDHLQDEIGDRAREGEAGEILKLMKEKARLKRGSIRAKWLSKTLKSYRVFHVSIGNLTFAALTIHILHALKVITF